MCGWVWRGFNGIQITIMFTVEGLTTRVTTHASVTTVHLFVSLTNKTPDRSIKSQGMWKACVLQFFSTLFQSRYRHTSTITSSSRNLSSNYVSNISIFSEISCAVCRTHDKNFRRLVPTTHSSSYALPSSLLPALFPFSHLSILSTRMLIVRVTR